MRRTRASKPQQTRAAHGAILFSAVLWGTLWIPLRRMNAGGLAGTAATTAGFLVPLVLLLPFAVRRGIASRVAGRELAAAGFFLALAISLYAEGVVRGQVARVLLLFYLTPAWSTLLARIFLGQPITGGRILTLLLGFGGVVVLFASGASLRSPAGVGDWMGFSSGIAWAVSMICMGRTAARPLFDRIFVPFVFLAPVFLLVALLPGDQKDFTPDLSVVRANAAWVIALAGGWLLPVIALTVFGASRLDPGRVAILLMLEIVVGLCSAALWADEPFGLREIAGAVLILAAAGAEVGTARLAGPAATPDAG